MKWCLFVSLICLTTVAKAQWPGEYSYVDSKALQVAEASTYSTAAIANYFQNNFQTDREKVRGIYVWVTNNIRYNKDSMFYRYWGDDPEKKLSSVLKNRKGVCEDYANLFTNLLLKCGIPSFVVSGVTNIGQTNNSTGHSWCAVMVDKEWLLCDPTWDEGFNGVARYFLVDPQQFIVSHFPFDPLWQLLEHPINNKEFWQGRVYGKADKPVFNYRDSVKAFLQLDTLQQQESAAARMMNGGLEDESLKTWYAYNKMKLTITYQENDMTVFNSAVADLNKAKAVYNDFVQYRNNLFFPSQPHEVFKRSFHLMDSLILSARKKAGYIGIKTENYQYDTEGLNSSLDALSAKALVQKDFLQQYLNASVAERQKLLYH